MTKWEYAWLECGLMIGEETESLNLSNMWLRTESGSTAISAEDTSMTIELNKLGREGWEVISVIDNAVKDGMVTGYLLKRPLAE